MNFIKNMFFFKRRKLIKVDDINDYYSNTNERNETCIDGCMEASSNIFTCTLNASVGTKKPDPNPDGSNDLDPNNAKVIVVPNEYVSFNNFEDRINKIHERNVEQDVIPLSNIKSTKIKQNIAVIPIRSNKTDVSDQESNMVNNVDTDILNFEFDEALRNVRKVENTRYSGENLSLSFIDDFFGKLNADANIVNNLNQSRLQEQDLLQQNIHDNLEINIATIDGDSKSIILRNNCKITETRSAVETEIVKTTPNPENNEAFRDFLKTNKTDNENNIFIDSIHELQPKNNSSSTHTSNNESGMTKFVESNKKNSIFDENLHISNINPNTIKSNSAEIIIIDDDENDSKSQELDVNTGLDTIDLTDDRFNNEIEAISDSDTVSYHSSNFEFITKSDAELDMPLSYFTSTGDTTSSRNCSPSRYTLNDQTEEWSNQNGASQIQEFQMHDVEINIPNHEINLQRHEIPQGDAYLDLFRGIYDPVMPFSSIYFLENKSVQVPSMDSVFGNIGFDMHMVRRDHPNVENEDDEESLATRRYILSTYPEENKRPRRY